MKKTERLKFDKLLKEICQENVTTEWHKLNYKFIPVTAIAAEQGNEVKFNELYKLLYNSNFKKILRTPSGGISIKLSERSIFDKYDVRVHNGVVEMTIATLEKSARIQFRLPNYKVDDGEALITAGEYLKKWWLPVCKKHGIDMNNYACTVDEGLEYKKLIHPADIKMYDIAASYNVPYANAHHIDFHKFYISGLLHACPEFKPVVDELVTLAKTDKMHKTGLAAMIGYFQSKYCGYKYAKLSMLAINDAYSRFDEVKAKLVKEGRRILATNTDGIWYAGEVYHGEYEGPNATEWQNDHVDCYIRFKSAGAYEYIENNSYTPVVRGRTKLDKIMPRSEWQWGDIFKETANVIYWTFEEGTGIIWKEN